jgi:hypothetical protein
MDTANTMEIELPADFDQQVEAHRKGSYCDEERRAKYRRAEMTKTWPCLPSVEAWELSVSDL